MTDFHEVKAAQRDAWSTGDFGVVARHTVFPGELLCESVDLRAEQRVLDVATGSGNVALSAARRGAHAVGVDYVPALLERGRQRAAAEQVSVLFQEGDCEDLPFSDDSFDVVFSLFGAMFAPNHQCSADELVRVCRSGGRIALACWTPEGFWGQVFALQSRFLPPPAGLTPPTAWGTEAHLRSLFGDRVRFDRVRTRIAHFRHGSADDWLEFFRTYFGPMIKAFGRLPDDRREAFEDDLRALASRFNCADDGTLVVTAEYLETVMTKR